jgi:hypothetical protein
MCKWILINQTLEMFFKLTGDVGRPPGARAVDETLGPLGGKALGSFA